MKWYTLGLAFPLIVIVYFKLFLTPPNDLFDQSSSTDMLKRITHFVRYSFIGGTFFNQIFVFGNGKLSILLIAVYGVIVGRNRSDSSHPPISAASIAILLQLAGYFLIYVLTPHDLQWHLRTSLYRLMIHVFPAALFLFFVSITDPETIFATEPKPSISR
jgi:hypothetical protein